MLFEPKTEQQIEQEKEERAKASVWPVGLYSFEVINSFTFGNTSISTEETTSQQGNPMIRLVMMIYNDAGESRAIIDNLMALMPEKLRNAAVAFDMLDQYNTGQLHAYDIIGKKGDLRLGVAKSGKYAGKNEVVAYITDAPAKPSNALHPFDPLNDEIPFSCDR